MSRGGGAADKPPRFTKPTLPEKPCAVCGRPFAWRKKWARVWAEVRYCSEACRARRGGSHAPAGGQG